MKSEVTRMLTEGKFQVSTSPWRAQVNLFGDGLKPRMVIDYSQDAFPFPNIQDLLIKQLRTLFFPKSIWSLVSSNPTRSQGHAIDCLRSKRTCFWGTSFASCPYGDVFGGTIFARCPYGDVVFSQISWYVPILQTCEANFSKPRTDTDTMFSLNVAQDPRVRVHRKKFLKKNWLHGFSSKDILKKRSFWLFFIFDPLYLRTQTKVHGFVICTSVLYATFWTKMTSKVFFILSVFGQKRGQNGTHIFLKIDKRYRNRRSLSRRTG